MAKTYWKCMEEECNDDRIYGYRGLCRSCTVYKEDKVSKPIQRVRVTDTGTIYIAPERVESLFRGPVTRKQQKEWGAQMKAEKKHKIALRRAKRMMRENTVPEEHKEALESFVAESIGEQVHVHDENCNHEEE